MKRNRIVAALLAMIMLLSTLMLSLGSCGPDEGGEGGGTGNKGKKVEYSVTLVTEGGMPLADIPAYFVEYKNGKYGDTVIEIAASDKNGKITAKLPENGSYAVSLSLKEGYIANDYYPLTSANTEIKVTSAVISDSDLSGVSYTTGSVMHDFTVTTTTGDTFTLSEVLKEKKAVLINFWYSTCGPCQSEFPTMVKAYEKYKDDFAIIALNPPHASGGNDDLFKISQFQASYGLTFDVAQDNEGLWSAFGIDGYPTSIMVDRYGVVTLFHKGPITSERTWEYMFSYFTQENYEQKLVFDMSEIVPKEKPNVSMPSSEEIGNVFEKEDLGDITYLPYPDSASESEKEYSWPFVTAQVELNGVTHDVIKSSNAFKEGSFAQLIFDIELDAGDVLAFDYFTSTEKGVDLLYVVVDGKDIYSISGESSDWATCYAFVAEEKATYEIGLVYAKDSSDDKGQDTVYLKDLRIVSESDIDTATYIYRFAATNLNRFNEYQDYITPVLGSDGYYHVNDAKGPILLANLMGYTRFADDDTVYYMAVSLFEDELITVEEYNKLIEYCNYASNAAIYGVSSVTPELKALLDKIVFYFGDSSNENDWQRLCCYYDAYGTGGKPLTDPIQGLALFSAYEVVEGSAGSNKYPNSFTYDRVIMPRGLLGKFTPKTSGTYLISSNAGDAEVNAWIFTKGSLGERTAWLTYENVDRMNRTDLNNCYMIAYLEAGQDYYIDIAYYDVYGEGTINYRVERLGGAGYYRLSLASPGYFSALLDPDGGLTATISGGIELELGDDGYWHEKRKDGVAGSLLYADFTMVTPLFENNTLAELIDKGGFDFTKDSEGNPSDLGPDYTELARKIYEKRIVAGDNKVLGTTVSANDPRIGCVIVDAEVAEVLQLLVDKYSFSGIENSWAKLCYYTQYFCAATPN